MAALGKWLRADKARGQQVMWQNQSFIFFRELANDAEGPMGAMSVGSPRGAAWRSTPAITRSARRCTSARRSLAMQRKKAALIV